MPLENPFRIFYDSDFESLNESNIFDDTHDLLNVAFIASPGKSISFIHDDPSLSDLAGKPDYDDEKEYQEKVSDQKINKLLGNKGRAELTCQGNHMETAYEFPRKISSLEKDLKPCSVTNSIYTGENEKNWVSSAKRNSKPRFDGLESEIGNLEFSEISETEDLSKKNEEKPECIFNSTCLDDFQTSSKEYDWSKFEKRSFFEMDDEWRRTKPELRTPVSRFDYVRHELSTIAEVDSLFMDKSGDSLLNSNKHSGLFTPDSNYPKFLKASDSLEIFLKPNSSSNFPANVMKVIQNKHIEKFLQEPGILEESDLTLISTDLDSACNISEKSTEQRYCHSYYKIKRFNDEESPSMISFLQHELSCMEDCAGE